MPTIINGVSCEEIREGFEEGINSQGPHATKKYLCDWADRFALANGLIGFSVGTGPGGPVTQVPATRYPESQNMFAREVTITGKGKSTQGTSQIQFTKAIVAANFGVPQFGYSGQPYQSIDPAMPFVYATQEIDFGREMITIGKEGLVLANGHKLKELPYAVPLPHAILTIQLQRVPYLPAQAMLVAMGKPINLTTFLGVQPGYLMFDGCKSHAEAVSDGSYAQNLTLVFRVRPVLRWDETWDPDGVSGPQQVRYMGLPILQRTDLSTLIPSAYGGNGP